MSTPWYLGPLAVLDTETTGLDPDRGDRVIEVAIVAFDGGQVTERWGELLQPDVEIPAKVTEITGIRPEHLRGKPRFADVAHAIADKLQGRLCVAYNAGFDKSFLIHEFARAGVRWPAGLRWVDPLVLAKQLQKGQGGHKLGEVAKRLGVPLEEAHRATADAECAGRVLLELAKLLHKQQDVADYAPMRELHDRWEAEQESQRAGWKSRNRSTSPMVFDSVGPGNALGPGYPHGDELDPVRYIFLKGVGRTA